MLFAVLFNDFPGMAEVRAQNLAAHLAWLEEHQAVIPVGGSLRRELNETPKGGLWIADAQSKEELDALLRTDPFFTAG
ncbi:MAG: YciI family protein, partial [Comamonas sp.]